MTNSLQKITKKHLDNDWVKIVEDLTRGIGNSVSIRKKTDDQLEYIKASKEVLFFLQFGTKPSGLSNDDFLIIKPLIQSIVNKGQLKKEIMELFI